MTRVSLFTSNSKKIGKRLLSIICIIVLLFIIYKAVDFCIYVPATETNARLSWNRYYSATDNIDSLFLGSSHVHSDINIDLLDQTNQNIFMFSTAGQSIRDSYYVFKEVSSKHNVKDVYLEVYFRPNVKKDIVPSWRILDWMKYSPVKCEYIYNICNEETFFDTIFPVLRYRTAVFDVEQTRENIEEKISKQYIDYQSEMFTKTGFMGSEKKLIPRKFIYVKNNKWLEEDPLDQEAEQYLRKMIEECQDKGIRIHLFSSPITNLELLAIGNYDYYVEQLDEIVAEYGIEYYDFNLCKREYLPLDQATHFRDTDHLNNEGAGIYTNLFEDVVMNSEFSKEESFYSSYAEKNRCLDETVWGIIRLSTEKQEEIGHNCMLATNGLAGMEYKIIFSSDEGNEILIQDYSENIFFTLPSNIDGICTIEMRDAKGKNLEILEIEY